MMLGVPGLMMPDGAESGGASGGSSEVAPMEEIGGGGGGNRWPRQETLALLRIRSDMDATFRDASLKGPLWEEVSRKMGELGFQRSAKKCKEKFENVYKYHKRTKDGRASKSDGKTYRFFDQLEALENTPPNNHFTPPRPPPPPQLNTTSIPMPSHVTVSSTSPTPLSVANPISYSPFQPPIPPQSHHFQLSHRPILTSPASNATSSSTSSDEDIQRRRGRKRKWKDYLERLMKDVVKRQEELQKRFLETLEKSERDRIAREEAWRVQEMARMNREHDRLAHERSIAAAKDAAVIAFLQKVTGEKSLQIPVSNTNNAIQKVVPPPENQKPAPPPPPAPVPQQAALPPPPIVVATTRDNGGDDLLSPSSSRWPKAEVEALIKLRTDLENRYQENGPKGPLWEEISKSMAKIGYNRSSKRCKEKWENINKYFKKVKESNKKRPQDSKTCPYFQQLDAIYRERAKNHQPIMARPEQQWPQPEQQNLALHGLDHDNHSERNENEEEEFEEEDEDEEVGEYEIMASKQPSPLANTAE